MGILFLVDLGRGYGLKLERGAFFMRVKVKIICKSCGERFVLRGKKERGRIETGFKQCLCDNRNEFEVEEEAPL